MTHDNRLELALLAVAEEVDGPAGWIHLCVTAAEEATDAVNPVRTLSTENRRALVELMNGKSPLELALEAPALTVRAGYAIEAVLGSQEQSAKDAALAAAAAYRANLPPITNRRSVQSFVACVAVGVLRGFIAGRDANTLLYAAQAALTAFPKRKPRRV